jgi:hypothetical protein
MKMISCNFCGKSKGEILFHTQDLKYKIDGEFSIVKCKNCGLVFLDPQPSVERLKMHYPGPDYHGHKKVGVISLQDAEIERDFLYKERKRNIYKYERKGKERFSM